MNAPGASCGRSPGARAVRIGGASGFWGDSSVGAQQLVQRGQVDYLVFDYLAELTMSILAGARLKDPTLGYATDFVTVTMQALLREIVSRGIRVVSNAGGVNPAGCAAAIAALAQAQGVEVRIAVVEGDDVTGLHETLRQEDVRGLEDGAPLPARLVSANAYLGAEPIRQALDAGAQIVVTGRCVDSAVTLGVLMHEFGWRADELDLLAQGSLAGHLIECGCQATGGLYTDWASVPRWEDIGYPVLTCHADGRFSVGKPAGTGGLVTPATVAEQLLYEIGDPARYLLPDVVCDFTQVRLTQVAEDEVAVSGARGLPPTPFYKVCATWMDGWRCAAQLVIVGLDAAAKARRTGQAILDRTGALLQGMGLPGFSSTFVEVLGAGAYAAAGPEDRQAREARDALELREVVLRVVANHPDRRALQLFSREIAPAGTSWSPGTTGAAGRPAVSPLIRQFAFLLEKARVQPRVHLIGSPGPDAAAALQPRAALGAPGAAVTASDSIDSDPVRHAEGAEAPPPGPWVELPLIRIAHGRSGDKGDTANIGVIARQARFLPLLREQLTAEAVARHLAHLVQGPVARHELPGIGAFNFVCQRALGGGGMASMRADALGKGLAQVLLTLPVRVPRAWAEGWL
ncbi:MAG: acyclic terpene utilization AtuA family protein [Rubrivivax sp.]